MKTAQENMKMLYKTIVAFVVNTQGGYREKEVMQNPHTYEQGETWNSEHKVIDIVEIEADADGHKNGFQVDIVTKSICG